MKKILLDFAKIYYGKWRIKLIRTKNMFFMSFFVVVGVSYYTNVSHLFDLFCISEYFNGFLSISIYLFGDKGRFLCITCHIWSFNKKKITRCEWAQGIQWTSFAIFFSHLLHNTARYLTEISIKCFELHINGVH